MVHELQGDERLNTLLALPSALHAQQLGAQENRALLFRYLWRGLPVVALAAALLVTAGLVLLVRQFLHDVDRRTTMFAVLVGLLLTASPAVLVLLGR